MRRLLLLIAVGLVACGGDDAELDPLEFDHPATKPLTACADASIEDAFVLALRYQSAIRFNEQLANDYAWALNSARAAYPALCEQRAFADMTPDTLVVHARDTRALGAWRDGNTVTGVKALDRVLDPVGVTDVRPVQGTQATYLLTLAQPVNARALARELDRTGLVDARARDISADGGYYFDGREYVPRRPSDIKLRGGDKGLRLVFERADGDGSATVVVQHNGVVGVLDDR